MALCSCPDRPCCQWDWCELAAEWSIFQPRWGERRARFKFMCDQHAEIYRDAIMKPIRGIDRPSNAPEDWRGSLVDCINHALIAIDFEKRSDNRPRHTSAQLSQIQTIRKLFRDMRK